MFDKTWDEIVACLPHDVMKNKFGFWYNEKSDEIMCITEEDSAVLSLFFRAMGCKILHERYYKPSEYHYDDARIGFYSIHRDGHTGDIK